MFVLTYSVDEVYRSGGLREVSTVAQIQLASCGPRAVATLVESLIEAAVFFGASGRSWFAVYGANCQDGGIDRGLHKEQPKN